MSAWAWALVAAGVLVSASLFAVVWCALAVASRAENERRSPDV